MRRIQGVALTIALSMKFHTDPQFVIFVVADMRRIAMRPKALIGVALPAPPW